MAAPRIVLTVSASGQSTLKAAVIGGIATGVAYRRKRLRSAST